MIIITGNFMKQFCLQLRLLALKTLQDQPREAYTSPDKASNAGR